MPTRRNLFDKEMKYKPSPEVRENEGMGQVQPVRRPLPNGAPDQSQAGALPPPPQPLTPLPGMTPETMAIPGAGGDNTIDLLNMLQKLNSRRY